MATAAGDAPYDVTVSVWNRCWSPPLAEGLSRAGYRVRVVGTTRRGPVCADYRICWPAAILTQASFHCSVRMTRVLRELALWLFGRFGARHVAGSRCFWSWYGHSLRGLRQARRLGIPAVLEVGSTHILWAERRLLEERRTRRRPVMSPFSESLVVRLLGEYAVADRICVPSRAVRDTFAEAGVTAPKVVLNPYGVDVDFWGAGPGEVASASGDRLFTAVFTGGILLRKGVAYLLDAWLRAGLPHARLLLAGFVESEVKDIVKARPDSVTLLGYQSHEDLRRTYAAADVYVLPSLEEGLARAGLEAMAAGLPVIVTPETGITDVMVSGEDGWVVPSRDSAALARALTEAASDPVRLRRMGISAKRRVQPFTWKSYGDRGAAFLRTLIGDPR